MCGIAGIFDSKAERDINRDVLLSMRDAIDYRGPDMANNWYGPGIGLAHRRLSVIDLSGGQQPMRSTDGKSVVVFNGEIYNFKLLRQQLKELGHVFTTRSDTEVLLNAWCEWGEKCVDKLRGMFAFCIWDGKTDSVFLARDRLGIKPLVYAFTDDGHLVFGSEIKAVLQYPGLDKRLRLSSMEDYFTFGYVADPHTIYSAIDKLAPGYTLLCRRGQAPRLKQYWDLPVSSSANYSSFESASEQLRDKLVEAVDIRCVADVPFGAFLSGGVDSSAVVSIMAGLQDDPVHTCSIGFNNAKFDESSYADRVAKRYATHHNSQLVDDSGHELVDELAALYDEPFADSSALPTYKVCALARQQVTVALSGDGADELFAGYRRHRLHMNEEILRSRLPLSVRKSLFGTLGRFYPKADWAPQMFRAKTTLQSIAMSSTEAYLNTVSQNSASVRNRLYSHNFKQALDGYSSLKLFTDHANAYKGSDPLQLIQYLDMKTYLPGDILTKVDKASMRHSLEVRVPFLDHQLVEWGFVLPQACKIRGGVGKALLKASMEASLDHDILYRSKMGFSVPLANWFRGPLKSRVNATLAGERLNDCGLFDTRYLGKVSAEHASGARDHSTLIWSLVMFDAFLKLGTAELVVQPTAGSGL